MRSVTIKEAKAHLNELIDAATSGEQVVLMRGSRHVATLTPITEKQLELVPELSDAQAERSWARFEEERRQGKIKTFRSATTAVEYLAGLKPPRKRKH